MYISLINLRISVVHKGIHNNQVPKVFTLRRLEAKIYNIYNYNSSELEIKLLPRKFEMSFTLRVMYYISVYRLCECCTP